MIQTTLKEALRGKIDTTNHHVYLVRDETVTFYVGQSHDVVKRLRHHRGVYLHSALGLFIKMNRDAAPHWLVEFFTVEELVPLIQAMRERRVQHHIETMKGIGFDTSYYEQVGCRSELDASPSLDEAEGAMIRKHSPCLNVEWNPTPSPLPGQYNTRLVVKSRYPFPFCIPEKVQQQFTLMSVPLSSPQREPSTEANSDKTIRAAQMPLFTC